MVFGLFLMIFIAAIAGATLMCVGFFADRGPEETVHEAVIAIETSDCDTFTRLVHGSLTNTDTCGFLTGSNTPAKYQDLNTDSATYDVEDTIIDGDSATTIVVLTATTQHTCQPVSVRIRLSLSKVHGTWTITGITVP